jgi:indole-3-glycerol phosphate synthase
LIGVNNRDLHTFHVSLDVSRSLIAEAPDDTVMISESGLRGYEELAELFSLGYRGFLVGETLMKSSDPAKSLRNLLEAAA